MKKFVCFLGFLALFCSTGCLSKNPVGLWLYTHSTGNTTDDTLLTPTSFLNLRKDGFYTLDFGSFEHGHWKYQDGKIVLVKAGNVTTNYPVKAIRGKDLQLMTGEEITANFELQPSSFASAHADPFSFENNKWRIRAVRKETEDEIRKRLLNHCKFWEAYFSWAMENQLDVVDVRSTPTLIKIYGNGFGLKPYEELSATWRSYFFDREDCRIANNLLYEVFQYKTISWAHTDNKYKMFTGAFQQLQQHLK